MSTPNEGGSAPIVDTTNTPAEAPVDAPEASGDAGSAPEAAIAKAAAGEELSKAEKAEIKKWKLKIDGREEELTEDELVKHAQLGKAAHKRMQEAAEYKKTVNAFIESLRADPMSVLTDPNMNIPPEQLKRLAEMVMNNEIEEMRKTPEERERDRYRKELEEIKAQRKKEAEEREALEFQRLQEQAAVQLDNDISSALESGGLPKSARTVKMMAEYMMLALEHNIDISAKDLVPIIRKQATQEIREMFDSTPEDLIEEFLGKDNLTRVRKRSLAKMKEAPAGLQGVKPTGEETKKKAEKPAEKIPFKSMFKPF